MEPNQQPVQRFPRWMYAFIPTKDVAVTPILISLNILVWVLMVATGVSPYAPDLEDVMAWGASNTDAVVSGEYWRLWTSNYLHYGFLHLGVNMLSLHNVGRLLERFIGKWRFGLLYTFTGIFASAVSIWWHPYSVGVGASGAILGIVGVLTALLTTNLIDKSVRWQMLRSIGFSILLMLVIGLNAGIDNAAHFGGLFSGAIGGYLIYPELKSFYYEAKKLFWGLIASLIIIAGGAGWLVLATNPPTIHEILSEYDEIEKVRLEEFGKGKYDTPEKINSELVEFYQSGVELMEDIRDEDFIPEMLELARKREIYLQSRMNQFEFESRAMQSNDPKLLDSVNFWRDSSIAAHKGF